MSSYTPYYPGGWQDSPNLTTPVTAAALTNFDAGIEAAAAAAAAVPGPNLALLPLRMALANAQTTPARIAFVGDSYTDGQGSTGAAGGNRWTTQLAAALRRNFGFPAGGQGFWSGPTGENSFTWPLAVSGGTFATASHNGPNGTPIAWNSSSTGTASITVTGTSVDVHYLTQPFGAPPALTVNGTATTITTPSATSSFGWCSNVPLGPHGTYTLQFAYGTGTAVLFGVTVYDGDEAAGIVPMNFAHYGSNSSDWATNYWLPTSVGLDAQTLSGAQAVAGVTESVSTTSRQPHAVFIALGLNDSIAAADTPAVYQANLETMIGYLRTYGGPNPMSIILLAWPQRYLGSSTPTAPWSQYVAAMQAVAAADTSGLGGASGVAFLDMSNGNSLPSSQTVNGTPYATVYSPTDFLHPSNIGQGIIASHVANWILAEAC